MQHEHRTSSIIFILSPEQWMGRSIHQIYKVCHQKCINAKSYIYVALLQIRSTPLGPGVPSPAMLLFNCPIRGIMPIINRILITSNDDDDHYEELVKKTNEQ